MPPHVSGRSTSGPRHVYREFKKSRMNLPWRHDGAVSSAVVAL
jgi:hypothetical protein